MQTIPNGNQTKYFRQTNFVKKYIKFFTKFKN